MCGIITLTICGKEGSLETWNARNGHIETMEEKETVTEAGKAQKETITKADKEGFVLTEEMVFAQKEFKYMLSKENIAVLDCADIYWGKKCIVEAEDILKADRTEHSELGFSWCGSGRM